jgi:hypothetical protein
MTRHLFRDRSIGTGVLPSPPAEAQQWQCEDRAANCLGRYRQGGRSRRPGRPSEQVFALRPAADQMRATRPSA